MLRSFVLCLMVASAFVWARGEQDETVLNWLALVDQGEYAESWQQAAPFFQQQITQARWQQALKQTRTPLGKQLSRHIISANQHDTLPGAPAGDYVVVSLKAEFENKKSAIETVTVRNEGDRWKVVGYFIR